MTNKIIFGQVILTDKKGICWKFNLTEDMILIEILNCVEEQFYQEKVE